MRGDPGDADGAGGGLLAGVAAAGGAVVGPGRRQPAALHAVRVGRRLPVAEVRAVAAATDAAGHPATTSARSQTTSTSCARFKKFEANLLHRKCFTFSQYA